MTFNFDLDQNQYQIGISKTNPVPVLILGLGFREFVVFIGQFYASSLVFFFFMFVEFQASSSKTLFIFFSSYFQGFCALPFNGFVVYFFSKLKLQRLQLLIQLVPRLCSFAIVFYCFGCALFLPLLFVALVTFFCHCFSCSFVVALHNLGCSKWTF